MHTKFRQSLKYTLYYSKCKQWVYFLRVGLLNQVFAFSTTRGVFLFSLLYLLLLLYLPFSLSHAFYPLDPSGFCPP